MGAGKSAVAREVAKKLSWKVVDLDELIEAREGRKISTIFESQGEDFFRDREHEALKAALKMTGVVIACGGGVLLRRENRALLKGFALFNLNASFDELYRRVCGTGEVRPLARCDRTELKGLYESRERLYRAVANQIETEGRSPKEVAVEIVERFGARGEAG